MPNNDKISLVLK